MIKMFLSVLFLMCAYSQAQAGANFTTSFHTFEGERSVYPMVGLAIDQKIAGKFYLSSWAGLGSRPVMDDTKSWGSMKIGVDYRMRSFNVGMGVAANVTSDDWEHLFPQLNDADKEKSAYVKVTYKLW